MTERATPIVRRHDLRELQDELARLGLRSLGRMAAHAMASLQAVVAALFTLRNLPVPTEIASPPPIMFDTGDALLAEHADAILGPARRGRETRIMVTMPGEAADLPARIRDLVEAGMEVMRVNCARDNLKVRERMVKHLRRAEHETGKRCALSFDFAGPELRTGPIEPGPAVAKWRPVRDTIGRVTEPARVRLLARVHEADVDDATIPVEGDLRTKAKPRDTIELTDTRGRKRLLRGTEDRLRIEVTDAAMGSRAECVMLNKAPYIRKTLQFLLDVLGRMEEPQHKKTSRLRKLRVSDTRGPRGQRAASAVEADR